MCGEDAYHWKRSRMNHGRSPRVRGRHLKTPDHDNHEGTIPACAGKTASSSLAKSDPEDNPRVCGEDGRRPMPHPDSRGRSPRVRGRRRKYRSRRQTEGTIPACAGKTTPVYLGESWARDDPRVCGEDGGGGDPHGQGEGRSPRVRGRRSQDGLFGPRLGTIPACAGKTFAPRNRGRPRRDDPRVCGEDCSHRGLSMRAEGRSPRVRGRRERDARAARLPGTIPACAGKTAARRARSPMGTDDPRLCGED